MTVSSSVNRNDYAGNGSTTNFAVSFRFLQNSDVKATLRDALSNETLQVETTDYTLTGAGAAGGGTLVMIVAPPTGTTLTIQRDVPATQETDYVENDEFPAESHEDALDKLTMLVQQQIEDSTRHMGFSDTVSDATGSAVELSQDKTQRADKLLGFDSAGNLVTTLASAVGLVDQAKQDKRYSPIFATVEAIEAANPVALDGEVVNLVVGMIVAIDDYATGNGSGLMFFRVVGPATGIADGGSYIDLANSNQIEQNFPAFISAKLFGAVMDGVVDDRLSLFNADAFGPVTLPAGTAKVKSALTFTNSVFFAGGGLSIDTAITVTFSNGLTANPDHQIFTGLGTVAGFSDGWLKWWGAKGGDQDSEASGNDSALASMIRYMKTFAQGVEVNAGAGRFRISLPVLIPEKCGLNGAGTTTTFFKAKSSTAFANAMFENETKTGVGQEFMFLRRMRIDGNRSGGATCEGIRLNQVFVNSTYRDLAITECSSHNIRCVASPDNAALGDGGPIELHNIWSDECGGNTLRIEGDFTVNVYGGAWEDVDAGQDVIHIDGALFGGTRAVVNFFTPHLEFSNANVRGIFINKGVVNISNAEMVGAQLSTQTNIHVEDDDISTLTINGMKQSSTVRKGVVFNVSGLQVDEAQIGHLSNNAYISTAPHESNGAVGADITLDMSWRNIVSLSAASATSIADINNASKDFIALRFSNGNYTIRNNANIKLKKGADFIVPTETTMCFIRINNIFYEISQSV
jgi:hypothetical protein